LKTQLALATVGFQSSEFKMADMYRSLQKYQELIYI
jgi:hypothetical protein